MTAVETPVDEPSAPAPDNVVAALARVESELGGIAKRTKEQRGQTSEAGLTYAYRGIDEIAAAAQPLLGRYGVVIVPTVTSRDTVDIVVNNKPWTDTTVIVAWSIYGPGGVVDVIEARTEGWGRDNSDKGINKAMTGAYKNLLLRLLCIGDPADDTDGITNERDAGPTDEERAEMASIAEHAGAAVSLYARLLKLKDTPAAAAVKKLADELGKGLKETDLRDPEWRSRIETELEIVDPAPADETTLAPTGPGAEDHVHEFPNDGGPCACGEEEPF